ncbi:MAG TPA: hypothetical protein VEV64_05545 [Rhizomicrobium sp.]|nr:hypothetical protein [Rhizomicrobium sp.]
MRLALKIPLIGVTTLEAMAASALGETEIFRLSATQSRKQAAAIHDARREEAYLSLLAGDHLVLDPVVMPFSEAIQCIRAFGPCVLAGTGAPQAATQLGSEFQLTDIRQPDALWVAKLSQVRQAPNDAPGPLYLRAPDAKLPGGKSLA